MTECFPPKIAFIKAKDLAHILSNLMLDSREIKRASCKKLDFLDEIRHTSPPTQKSHKKSNVVIYCNLLTGVLAGARSSCSRCALLASREEVLERWRGVELAEPVS